MEDFNSRIGRLDVSLFDNVPTQSTAGDRRAWLAVQRAVRTGGYYYLETGSYLGGSIQQHLPDPLCRGIVSIDKRPLVSPDDRNEHIEYPDNTTALMLQYLRRVDQDPASKVKTFDADATELDPSAIVDAPKFCFIDGEHTRVAAVSDFQFCLSICDQNAALCFHDARIINVALEDALAILEKSQIRFVARRLEGDTFGIFLRDCPAASDPYIAAHSSDGFVFLKQIRWRQAFKSLAPKWTRPIFRAIFPAP